MRTTVIMAAAMSLFSDVALANFPTQIPTPDVRSRTIGGAQDLTTTGTVTAGEIISNGDVIVNGDNLRVCVGDAGCSDAYFEFDGSAWQFYCPGCASGSGIVFNTPTITGPVLLPTDAGEMPVLWNLPVSGSSPDNTVHSFGCGIDSQFVATCRGQADGSGGADELAFRINSGRLMLDETTTPTAVTGFGYVYTKSDGVLYFQDSVAGSEQSIGGSGAIAYSSMWYHGTDDTVTISTANVLTKITSFVNVGLEDPIGNAVADPTTDDDITIGANGAGTYEVSIQSSFTNSGAASRLFNIVPCIDLSSTLTITDATNATPIVVTSSSHGLKSGDVVTISGVTGNTAANGDWTAENITASTFEIFFLDTSTSVGNGAYAGGGTVDRLCPGDAVVERIISSTELGRGSSTGRVSLVASDTLSVYAANLDTTDNLVVHQMNFQVKKIAE